MVSAIDGALGGVMARAPLLPAQSPPLNATDPAHRVTAWVQDHADRIELYYLPPYAPEHNPDEFLNNDLKQAIARRRTPRDKAALKSGLTSYMRSLQRCPAKVRAFFQAPTVRYAA
jgi:DDE superfamily endonuclease